MRNKRFVCPVCLAFLLAVSVAHAQTGVSSRPWEVSVSIGASSMMPVTTGFRFHSADHFSLKGIYDPYYSDIASGAVFSGSVLRAIGQRWYVGLVGGYDRIVATRYDPVTDRETGERSVNDLSLMPSLRFSFYQFGKSRYFLGAGAGGTLRFGKDTGEPYRQFRFSGELVPAGVLIGGKRAFFVGEVVVGTLCCGGRIGGGFRF